MILILRERKSRVIRGNLLAIPVADTFIYVEPVYLEANQEGTGVGGPGYKINCELDGDNQYHDRGVLSMAHAGRNTGGSQFFVCHSRTNTSHLDRQHTCFGKVYEGLEVINNIRQGDEIEKIVVK